MVLQSWLPVAAVCVDCECDLVLQRSIYEASLRRTEADKEICGDECWRSLCMGSASYHVGYGVPAEAGRVGHHGGHVVLYRTFRTGIDTIDNMYSVTYHSIQQV